jgi:biofilm PGA synthesis N-glycosyltransferase PgaC
LNGWSRIERQAGTPGDPDFDDVVRKTLMSSRYIIITPVKNEERFLEGMIESVLRQTIRPVKWIIVNDNSTDGTGEILRRATDAHDWIVAVDSGDGDKRRKPGGEGVVHCAIRQVNFEEYDFFARLDADISFEANYFERLFREFHNNSRLGIASGVCYVWSNGRRVEETHPRFHTRGALKTYRIRCYQEIGGLERELGWDLVDEIRANMLGWETRSFRELKVIHHRPTQTASGVLTGYMKLGMASYLVGYHPLFLLARAGRRLAYRPYVLGGLSMLYGFLSAYLKSLPRIADPDLIRYLREQQWNQLIGKETIWK